MNNEDRLFAYFATLPVEGALHTPTNAYRGNVEWRGVGRDNKMSVDFGYGIDKGVFYISRIMVHDLRYVNNHNFTYLNPANMNGDLYHKVKEIVMGGGMEDFKSFVELIPE